jgi:hypothetical protein
MQPEKNSGDDEVAEREERAWLDDVEFIAW